jgi:hypothetical protein
MRTCIKLLIDDKAVLSTTGKNDNKMGPCIWNVKNGLAKKRGFKLWIWKQGSGAISCG